MVKLVSKYGLLAMLVLQLSACGFHLRGTGDIGQLPFTQAQLQLANGVQQTVADAMGRQLERSGVSLSATAENAINLAATQYLVSQTSTAGLGDATSELIKMTQPFTVTDAEGAILLSSSVSAYRDRQINTAEILASDTELKNLRKAMASDIARQIMQRIQRGLAVNDTANAPKKAK